jgi:hypothetical protein
MNSLMVAVALAVAPAAAGPGVFDLEWTSFARAGRWEGAEVVTTGGELSGRATARLAPTGTPSLIRLVFSGESGHGDGLIGPNGPTSFTFPTAVPVGTPPAPPHLTGGTFEVRGDPKRPEGFVVSFVEGFICRATPRACGGVSMWERRFDGRARRR